MDTTPELPGEVLSEFAKNAAGEPVDPYDPTAVSIEVTWRNRRTGEVERTYLVKSPTTPMV